MSDPDEFWSIYSRYDAVCEFPGCKYVESGAPDLAYATDLIQDHWLSCHGGKGAGSLTGRRFEQKRKPSGGARRKVVVLGVSNNQTRKGYVAKSLMYDCLDDAGSTTRIRAHILKSEWEEIYDVERDA